MTRLIVPVTLALTLTIFACSKPQASAHKEAPASAPSNDCARGEPEPLLASASTFARTSPREALETVRTDSPIALSIRHYGCAHYGIDFDFTWPAGGMPGRSAALAAVADLLEKLPVKEDNRQAVRGIASGMRMIAKKPAAEPHAISETETLSIETPGTGTLRVRYDVAL